MSMTPNESHPWDLIDNIPGGLPPEPGTIPDATLGQPGPDQEFPENDREIDEKTQVNDDEEEDDG